MTDVTPAHPLPDFFSRQIREARRFYLDLSPPQDVPLAVVCGGYESCAEDYAIHRTTFPYYSVEFVARGKGGLTLGNQTCSLLPGTVFSYGPGVSQHITARPGELLAKYFVDFSGQRALDLLTQYRLPPGHIVRIGRAGEIQTVFENLIRDGLKGTGHAGPLCTSLLEYLIILIADSIIPTETRQSPAFTTYQRCREHIVTNFQRLTSLEQIAHECHIDQAYLCRLFRRHDHQTPYRYLLRLKMNRAAERLLNPAVLVKQVAVETGFDDPFHFSRAFKNIFGLSPEAFRRLR